MAEEYQTRKDIDSLYDLVWDNDAQQLLLITKSEFENVLNHLGIGKFNYEKFNFAVVNDSYWIMSNAKYDYDIGRFIKLNGDYSSFAICLKANSEDKTPKFYYNPKSDDVSFDDEGYDYTDYNTKLWLGATRKSDGVLVIYELDVGWNTIEYATPSHLQTWSVAPIDINGCSMWANLMSGLGQFRCYREETFTNTDYKLIGTLPYEYKPILNVVLSFTNPKLTGYVDSSNGKIYVASSETGTFTIDSSAFWHY